MTNDHFSTVGGVIAPQPWMQYRPLATKTAPSVSRSYDTSGGGNKNDQVHTVDVQWTNNSPVPQYVYGMVTRGGAQVTLQARSRGYLVTSHGVDTKPDATPPTSFDMVDVSKFGCGMDIGKGGILALGTSFGVHEVRQNSQTAPLMPHRIGMYPVQPGETFFARVSVRFVSEFWENTTIDGGDQNTESLFISGDTRVDLFGLPAVVPPTPRPTPTLVGVEHSRNNTFRTDVDVPEGVAAGDTMLAVVANQFGLLSDVYPEQSGWTLVHSRDGGWENAHLKVYHRIATGDEPASYTFANGLLAEEIVHLIVLRDASPDLQDGWQFASAMRKNWWQRDDGHIAPSLDRAGQYLICVSYVPHAAWQAPVNQAPPEDMTEISDVPGDVSSMAVAVLPNPPRPTRDRMFVPSTTPEWAGRSITVTILVPGAQQL
ncbi:hypothetical protein SEA_MASK_33 [Mycobacterium phage Mask]|nr:hypothetical protein SEA_MASK_33 [Mycobacterium phage Mask]